ncbi:MAG: molybdate ABC transporter permease subunit [Aquimarina sp.]|nr:molybdate ABC transporter permease subunit [Aquimarina sp.]
MDWGPLLLTLKLALLTTFLLFFVSVPIAYSLAYSRGKLKPVFEALISLPLVLPPTVLGFYLLISFSPSSVIGEFLNDWIGLQLVFSFEGLVFASILYSLPFMVQPLQAGLSSLPQNLKHASNLLGKSDFVTLFKVLLPNIKPSILTGIVLSFTHTIGEFGVVLMIGGNIPDKTRVASVAIFEEVESLNYETAHYYSAILLLVTFIILVFTFTLNRRLQKNNSLW